MIQRDIRAPGLGRVQSLPELLRRRADLQPADRAFTFLEDGEHEGARLTWAEVHERARAIGAQVANHAQPGSRALVLCPPGLDFVPAFFGALLGGVVAVPSYPPRLGRTGDARDRILDRLRAIVTDAQPRVVLAPASLVERASALLAFIPELENAHWIAVDAPLDSTATTTHGAAVNPASVAFLQYTSGSTAIPRGVMVTHANLLHNLADAQARARHDSRSRSVSWLPVIHDMGLIQGVLQPVLSGFPGWLMSPAAFLQRPVRWLQAITRTGATISGGPNFAYDLCVRRILPEERAALDLRSWELAFNGAEPIRQATLDSFARTFAPNGFDPRAFRPSYGLAEATLLVTSGVGPHIACGHTAPGTTVRIVDPATRLECPPGSTGEIWVAGPGVAAGYWNQPEATQETFAARLADTGAGPFLRTGDLGALREDGLHVTGRIKDILIVRGVKHFPQDIEGTVERASSFVRPGCCAVFALPGRDGDRVAVAAELDPQRDGDRVATDAVVLSIREAVGIAHGVQVSAIALVPPGTIPKTTSGKLQRYACREGLTDGRLAPLFLWEDRSSEQMANAS